MKVSEYNKKIMRQMAAEGAVLLENKGDILPIRAGETVSVFGRVQTCYYKSGTGSGGMVNVEYKTGILDGCAQTACHSTRNSRRSMRTGLRSIRLTTAGAAGQWNRGSRRRCRSMTRW